MALPVFITLLLFDCFIFLGNVKASELVDPSPGDVGCKSAEAWASRSIYFLVTDRFAKTDGNTQPCNGFETNQIYCQGTFAGLESKLDYIKGMGFDAIWISPIQEQGSLGSAQGYHGYWAKNWFSVNPNFGTEAEFRSLVSTSQAKGIWVMLDIALNHMVGPINERWPFNQGYHYHGCGGNGFTCGDGCSVACYDFADNCAETQFCSQSVENCKLGGGLDDIDQTQKWAQDNTAKLLGWVENFNINGLRLDAIKHMPQWYTRDFVTSKTECFTIGEALVNNANVGCFQNNYQKVGSVDGTLNFAIQIALVNAFRYYGPMYRINDTFVGLQQTGAPGKGGLNGLFIDNHDNAANGCRWLGLNGDYDLFRSALTVVFTGTGIPILYYGTEQEYKGNGDDQRCREPLWTSGYPAGTTYNFIKKLNDIRKKCSIWLYDLVPLVANNDVYAYRRGDLFVVLTNRKYNIQVTLHAGILPVGTQLCNVLDPQVSDCSNVFKGDNGQPYFTTTINAGPKIFVPATYPRGTCSWYSSSVGGLTAAD